MLRFFFQVIEILDGFGYDEDRSLDKEIFTKMLDREDFLIKTLRTF